ncbi:potassium-transporting ATPase A chain [Desulfocucumis palustris]|uniref:Potassium-transporting ATPase potassium-binding subunit n=1 Tax=Desulfocucumis palustris TaxID=1898651 RepID=A0A2L2X887_9FIRM|nr:potassium-transporting ATPase subunit KdpA [Desulfocucumis palustris]GBF32134.1 potassium-transporting ATPase A chain [Desulfocucumis palustris]
MKQSDIFQILLYLVLLIALAIPLGRYMFKVYTGERTLLDPVLRPLERMIYRLAGINSEKEMGWRQYTVTFLVFHVLGIVLLFGIELLQGYLPFNPRQFGAVSPLHLAFNTAVSFNTNTNWQAYGGESTMSYFTQMAGLTVHNFLSAAAGMVVVIALTRGLARRTAETIGNFWVDLTRTVLWILLPFCVVGALVLVSQGVIQNLSPYLDVQTLEGAKQTIAMGPVASQEIIKELGTNGGGFFNANSAHPFENPTPLTNLIEMLAILVIPVALTFTFGHMVGNIRQGRAIFAAMLVLFVLLLGVCYTGEMAGNPQIASLGVSGPSVMEGKEVRFGVVNSALWATVTTATSCGAVNAMHDSLTPLAGLVPLLQIMLGEVVFGGVGSGLYAMLVFVILTVFIVGLMVGRTPEYLGKKIESREMKMATLAVLIPAAMILIGAGLASVTMAGTASVLNPGPHGLSEMLYAFSSQTGNNGSAFAGLTANTPFYDWLGAVAMLIGRFGVIVPVLAIAGSMAGKKTVAPGPGTFETTGPLFTVMLAATVMIVGALTFFPALALGPIVEQLLMLAGKAF